MTAQLQLEAPPKNDGPEPLSDDELRKIIESEIRQSINHATSQIANEQQAALEYYEGRPFGNEVAGSSEVVLRDVAETIDWALPAIMRAFFYTQEVVRYEDLTPESEAAGHGRRMTQVVNEIFRERLHGFRVVYDWAKAGLLEKFATVKFWVETVRELEAVESAVLSAEQLVMLAADADVELFEGEEQQDDQYSVRWKRWKTYPRLRLETVPPEEFLVSYRAKRLDQQVDFVAQRRQITRSELHSLGVPWDVVDEIPESTSAAPLDGREVSRNNTELTAYTGMSRTDRASQAVTIIESYIRVDVDGDGYAEQRRVWTGGEYATNMIQHDYVQGHGFAGWTPIPSPHKLYGRDYADVVSDLQRIRSTLARQLLDNIYRMNNARHVLIEGEVDLESYLDTAPGAAVIATSRDAVEALETPPLGGAALDALKYFESVREQRTGVHPYSQESYAAGQNQTASGASQIFEAAMAQIQLLCQIFAESGLRDLFEIIPRAMKQAGIGPGKIKVGTAWIDYNPQEWPDDIRCSIQVGLSPGQTEQRIQRLLLIMGLQKEALAGFGPGYMVTPEQLYHTADRIVEQAGFQNPGAFFTSPEGKQMPQQPPSPDEIKANAEAKDKQDTSVLALSKLEFEREKEAKQTDRLEVEAQRENARELERIAMEERVAKYSADRQYEAALIQQEAQLAQAKATASAGAAAAEGARANTSKIDAVLAEISARLAKLEAPRATKKTITKTGAGYTIEEHPE